MVAALGGSFVGSYFLSWFFHGLFAYCPFLCSVCLFCFMMAVSLWLVFSLVAVLAHVL